MEKITMTRLCVIDLDGVVADSTARFFEAKQIDNAGRIDWKIAFDPNLVPLDTLIPRADQAVRELEARGLTIVFLRLTGILRGNTC